MNLKILVRGLMCLLLAHGVLAATAQSKPATTFSDPDSCLVCHQELMDEKVIHQAVKDACLDCHTELEPGTRPHKYKNNAPLGLPADRVELCGSCHGKILGKKKNVHKAVEKGCTACHRPHGGKYEKILKAPVPSVCKRCHEKTKFDGPVVHKPVQEGKCNSCHDSHASDEPRLLAKSVAASCIECHKDIKEGSHVVSGFARKGHPLGLSTHPAPDPKRPGKPFDCISCHEPHAAEFSKLVRIDPKQGMAMCQQCHEK